MEGFEYFVASGPANNPALGVCLPAACGAHELQDAIASVPIVGQAIQWTVRGPDFHFRLFFSRPGGLPPRRPRPPQ